MIETIRKTIIASTCVLALMMGALTGCANGGMMAATGEQQSNRSYMSQVNEIMDQLSTGLDSFVDAVSRGDIVNMRTQADDAYRILDKLSDLEAPDDLADVKQNYEDGSKKLREALDAYITLYADMESDSFDWSSYDSRISSIQSLYDEGVSSLQKGDEVAAAKE